MKLFFETAQQASVFLLILPIGIAFGVCIDLCACFGTTRPLFEVAAAFLCFLLIGAALVLLNDNTLRLYHLLAFISGWILYSIGLRRLLKAVLKYVTNLKKTLQNKQEKKETGRI